MADEPHVIHGINWRETFPFTHLFRTFRIAIHPSKLLLALLAMLAIYTGGRFLDAVWPRTHLVYPDQVGLYPTQSIVTAELGDPGRGVFVSFFDQEVASVNSVTAGVATGNWLGTRWTIASPSVLAGIYSFFVMVPVALFTYHPFYAILFTIWFLLVWSIFGGAIARVAAVHVARDEKISVSQALRFSVGKLLSFVFAPVIPIGIILAAGALVAAVGWVLLHIPYIGPIVLGALFVLALVAGFVMTLVLFGTVGGFNLMYPTIAVEGSDSFDAISRSFSYLYARPWRMLFYTAVAVAYGALTYLFVRYFIYIMLLLTHFFVGWWLGSPVGEHPNQTAIYWPKMWPGPSAASLPYSPDYETLKASEDIAAGLISFWVYLVISMLGAFAISFYFSANTIIYYLMRHEVDATELDDVYLEQPDEDFGESAPVTSSAMAGTTTTTVPAASPPSSQPSGAPTTGESPAAMGPTESSAPPPAPPEVPPSNQPPPT